MNLLASLLLLTMTMVQSASQIPPELSDLTLHRGMAIATSAYWENWHNGFRWNPGWRRVESCRFERPNSQADFQKSAATFTTSFEISTTCHRDGGDEIFVAGIQDDGDVVIERWVFKARPGRWHHVPPAMQPIGTPMGAYAGTTEIKGGTYAHAPEAQPAPERRTILESGNFSCVRGMAIDPEGRFLLFQDHNNGTLYRIRFDQGGVGTPETLFTIAQIPALAGTVHLNPVDHSSGKRLWILVEPRSDTKPKGLTKRVLLWDDDNDGVFDSHETRTYNDCIPILPPGSCEAPWKK